MVVVERSNGPSHACNSSNLAVWVRQYPVSSVVVACTGQGPAGSEQRAERGTERSVILCHLRFPIPDRGPTSGHLGVGLSPPRYLGLLWTICSASPRLTWACRLQYFCGLDFLTSTQTHAHAHTTHRALVRGRLSGRTACLLHFDFYLPVGSSISGAHLSSAPLSLCSANMRPSHDAQPHKTIISPWILCKV